MEQRRNLPSERIPRPQMTQNFGQKGTQKRMLRDVSQGREEYYFDSRKLADPNCPICHGKGSVKQTLKSGMISYPYCKCTLETQKRLAAEMRINRLLPGRLGQMRFENYVSGSDAENERALKVAHNFVSHWDDAQTGGWIIGFFGEPSAGKTHLAAALTSALVQKDMITPYFLSVPRMNQLQRESFGADETTSPLRQAIDADLLVIDDLGAAYIRELGEGKVSWAEDLLYQIIDERINNNRPIVYTTNYDRSTMERRLPSRIYERLMRNAAIEPLRVNRIKRMSRINLQARDILLGDDSNE